MSCETEDVGETAGETSQTYDEEPERMSASLEVEYPQFNPPENLSSPPVAAITTPAEPAENCPNCPTLTKENRKLSNSVKTLREAAKKRRAEIRKLRKKGLFPIILQILYFKKYTFCDND